MPNRLKRTLAVAALVAAPLTLSLAGAPALAAGPSSVADGDKPDKADKADKADKKEKPDPAWKEAYERLHEPKEKSEQKELAREQKEAGR
ncbi:hypothetical protein [Streptomyces spirodelae]|uniref:Uncharacterized protein n=1 Tax=Streptomyces spirodelae TaxID=2812904 RepID=A0ABS3WQT7_9ACTN|nr:hypothetical protein [Streptomyces spirodelae]MBO8185468.1 hypothetical protein [Streptomyces spirodelae]